MSSQLRDGEVFLEHSDKRMTLARSGAHVVSPAPAPAAGRADERARDGRRLQGEGGHRHVQLCVPCRRARGRHRARPRRDPRLRDRRRRRQARQSDGGRRPDLWRRGAGHRHGAVRRDAVTTRRVSRSPRRSPITFSPARPKCPLCASCTWRRRRLIRSSARKASAKAARSRRRRRSSNAINDALAPLGVEITESPVTPRKLLAALESARASVRPEPVEGRTAS